MAIQDVLFNATDSLLKQRIGGVRLSTVTSVEAIESIIQKSAIAGAGSAVATAWLPGVGATVASGVGIGILYNMYYQINRALGLQTSQIILRSVASAVCANIASYLVGSVAVATVASLVPVIGSGVATVVVAGMSYALMLVSGIVYLLALRKFLERGIDPSTATAEELADCAKDVADSIGVKSLLKEAQSSYKKSHK